jgi:hypothetical protein
MKKKKASRRILKWFPEPIYATELTLMPFYELICYIVIFVFFGFLFFKFHNVPIREFEIYAERIDDNRDYYTQTSHLDVDWLFPMSSIISDTENGRCYLTCSRTDDSVFHVITATNRLMYGDKLYGRDELYSYLTENMETINDNWKTQPAYYISIKSTTNDFYVRHATRGTDVGVNNVSNMDYEKKGLFIKNLKTELYFAAKRGRLTHEMKGNLSNTPYSRPKLYSLFDISQSYIKLRVKTNTIDDISLSLDFDGATEIDDVRHVADSIYSSRVVYNITNVDETDSEILLYVRFKDLENMQALRLFAVSSVIGGLIMVFIAFLVIYFYRLFARVHSDRPAGEEEEEETNQEQTPAEVTYESDEQQL